jgi:hypothetical protein
MQELANIDSSDRIKDLIYTVRGVKVMLDSDLADIYGYTTKTLNQQVKNNIAKFDDDFRFQLTKEEYHLILRSKNLTIELGQGKFSKYLPYVFTEQGVYMLMTVLKGELATRQSKALVRAFKEMKDLIIYSTGTERIIYCRASSKDAGNKVTTITEVSDRQVYHPIVDALLLNPVLPFN